MLVDDYVRHDIEEDRFGAFVVYNVQLTVREIFSIVEASSI